MKEYSKNKEKYSFEDWEKALVYFMEYMINNVLIPGQIENWNTICDFDDVSALFLPAEVKKLMAVMASNYRCRLYVMYILNLSFFLRGLWSIGKSMMDPITQKKIQVLSVGDKAMFNFINKSQVEQLFGGTAKTVESYCFPPIFPSDKYIADGENWNSIFMNEEEYRKKG